MRNPNQRTRYRTMEDYWALKPVDEIGDVVIRKVRSYQKEIQENGRLEIWRRAARTYFGLNADGSWVNSIAVTFSGSEGEYVDLRGNLFRMFVRAQCVLATGSRPSFNCRPRAYDAQTTELVQIGNAICEMYLDRSAETRLVDGAVNMGLYGEGWLGSFWDPFAGARVDADEETGEFGHEGDVEHVAFRPDEVIRDSHAPTDDHDWVIVRRIRNRWTLAHRYPQHAEYILGTPAYDPEMAVFDLRVRGGTLADAENDDQIITYELYHRSTDAMPRGRMSLVVGERAIADGPNPYDRIPLRQMIASREPDTNWGYAETWDLLALSQVFDSILSQVTTTQENFGLQNIMQLPDALVTTEAISRGTRILYTAQPPMPMQQQGNGAEQGIAMLEWIIKQMQMQMSMNDASLGSGSSAPSGASLAMQMQIATQNNAGIVRTYLQVFKDVLGDTIEWTKRFASVERVVHIVGKNNAPKVERFSAETLQALEGVDVELGSAEMRTLPMRHQLMTELLGGGLLKTPEEALQMMSTGRLEPAFNGPQAREACIERENEELLAGRDVIVLDQDFHADHIARHGVLLADPKMRADPAAVQRVQSHLYEHAMRWASMSVDPVGVAILAATGQQPSPSLAVAPPPGAGAPPPGNPGDAQQPPQARTAAPPDASGAPTQNPDVANPTTAPQGPSPGPANMPSLPPDARPIPTTY